MDTAKSKKIDRRTHTGHIAKIQTIAENTIEVTLSFEPGTFSFAAGQYVWIELPTMLFPETKSRRRAFSICSGPADTNNITIAFRMSESGYKKTLAALPPGSPVTVTGPCGSAYIIPEETSMPVVMLAGGIGITPLISILEDETVRRTKRRCEVLYFNTDPTHTTYREILQQLADKNPAVAVHFFFGIPDMKVLEPVLADPALRSALWFVSGPQGLVTLLGEALTKAKIPESQVHYEENHPTILAPTSAAAVRFEQPDLFRQAVSQSSNHIIFTDENGRIKFANEAAQFQTGYSLHEMFDQTPRLWGGLMEPAFYTKLWHTIKDERRPFSGKIRNRKKDGTEYVALARISPIISVQNTLIGFVGTEEDITELEDLDRAKTEFLSMVSHQLQTPLTGIAWYTEMFLSGKIGKLNEQQTSYLQEIYKENRYTTDLVNDLLNLAHFDANMFENDPKPTNMVALADGIISELQLQKESGHHDVVTHYDPSLSSCETDPKLMRMIVQNLLSNAMKYTPKTGTVSITLHQTASGELLAGKSIDAESLAITVSDTGYGIPTHEQHNIFSKLFRADNVRQKNTGGTGLGLYIVKTVVDNLGGMIWFESEENKGSTFYVVLPFVGLQKKVEKKIAV